LFLQIYAKTLLTNHKTQFFSPEPPAGRGSSLCSLPCMFHLFLINVRIHNYVLPAPLSSRVHTNTVIMIPSLAFITFDGFILPVYNGFTGWTEIDRFAVIMGVWDGSCIDRCWSRVYLNVR